MVISKRERLFGLLLKWGRELLKSEDTTEELEPTEEPEPSTAVDPEAEPMKAYWETDQKSFGVQNQAFIDLFRKGLDRIPDTTEEPVKESHYKYAKFNLMHLPDALKNINPNGVQDTPKAGTGISSSGRDAGVVAGIVIAVISGIIILAALIAVVMYKHYVHRNVTSMNFDNPVYRKTTEDQFALEKNGYAPGSKLYPSTVGEEAQEPLNTPGTNDFV